MRVTNLRPKQSFKEYTQYTKYFLENYTSITDSQVESHRHEIKWGILSCQWRMRLPEDFIRRFKKYLNFTELSKRSNYSESILNDLKDYWDWGELVLYSKNITPLCIERGREVVNGKYAYWYKDRVKLHFNKRIPLSRFNELLDLVDWDILSEREDLTSVFIEGNIDKLDIEILLEYSNIEEVCSKPFIDKIKMILELKK